MTTSQIKRIKDQIFKKATIGNLVLEGMPWTTRRHLPVFLKEFNQLFIRGNINSDFTLVLRTGDNDVLDVEFGDWVMRRGDGRVIIVTKQVAGNLKPCN